MAPGLAALLEFDHEDASMAGALLGLVVRPLIAALMHLACEIRRKPLPLLRAGIVRRWD